MNFGLAGKVALVTGGSHGIGLATAEALKAEGCKVVICARQEHRLNEAATLLNALAIRADVQKLSDIERVMAKMIEVFETIHILVNNVGGGGRWGKPSIEETPSEVWSEVYQKNAGAASYFTRLVIPYMRKQKWGRVVTVASIHGVEGGGRPWFTMAKAAEIALMKTLARTPYLVRDGITFNTVAPGGIMIPDTGWEKEAQEPGFQERLDRDYPLGRLGTPDEVASVVAFLCSEGARLVNGTCVAVDGGESYSF